MAEPGSVVGWLLSKDDRKKLLEQFPPKYGNTVAHHVTLKSEAEQEPLPPEVEAELVGRTDDESGLQAMVVAIDGTTDRPDGSTFHITWSLGEGRRARESNDVLKERGWKKLDHPIPIRLEPGRF
jgi:imidazole glycerol phosphate synthase subunit HisF